MRRLGTVAVVVVAFLATPTRPAIAGERVGDNEGGDGGGSGEERDADWYEDHPDWGEVYCTDPGHEGKPVPTSHWVRMRGYWLTADGEIAGGEVGPTPNFAEVSDAHRSRPAIRVSTQARHRVDSILRSAPGSHPLLIVSPPQHMVLQEGKPEPRLLDSRE